MDVIYLFPNQMNDQPIVEPSSYPVYSRDFLLKPYIVIEHSHRMKKHAEDFLYAFAKRIDAQLIYQRNLLDCSKLLDKYIDANSELCLSYISSAFKVDNEQRASQAYNLADSLRTQVTIPLTDMTRNYSELIKKSEKSLKKLNKDYSYFQQNYQRFQSNYTDNDNQRKQLIINKNIYRFTTEFPLQKKNKLIIKASDKIRQKQQNYKNYKNSINQYNEIIELYRKETTEILNDLQNEERKHIKAESDAIRKLIICEVSMFKNVEYDLINISKQMQKIFPETDIVCFQEQAMRREKEREKQRGKQILGENEEIKDLKLKSVEIEIDKGLLSVSLKNAESDYYTWLLAVKKSKILRKAIEIRMKELLKKEPSNVQQSEGEQKKQESEKKDNETTTTTTEQDASNQSALSTSNNELFEKWQEIPSQIFDPPQNYKKVSEKISKKESLEDLIEISEIIHEIWMGNTELSQQSQVKVRQIIEKNHLNRIIAWIFIQEYRIEHYVLMQWGNYLRAGELIRKILDLCYKAQDVFTIKGILGLLFTFYSIEDEKMKKLLYQVPAVFQCQIWKRSQFWQAAIFESTFEEMANLCAQKNETPSETFLRQKNNIFSQLASYCHYMLMFNISPKTVKRIVGRYCRLYEMSESQNMDLSKMISNTSKQLKQIDLVSLSSKLSENS